MLPGTKFMIPETKILLIDDTPTRALALPVGCDYRIVHGFDQISFYLKNWKPHIILLDHDMGANINGIEVINMFRYELAAYPIIVVSQNPGASFKMVKEMEELTIIKSIPFLNDPYWTEQVQEFIEENVK
jgi:CheY-like chemotaxis protein